MLQQQQGTQQHAALVYDEKKYGYFFLLYIELI